MPHGYRTLQHWNQWLSHEGLGPELLSAEQELLRTLLSQHFGKHVLLLGVPEQRQLFEATTIPCQSLVTPFSMQQPTITTIESDFHDLPLLTGSIDMMIIPHTLEFIDNPRQLLAEACRVIKPEGLIAVCGFNPHSLLGIRKWFGKKLPWSGHFIPSKKVKNWLQLADFKIETLQSCLFIPPLHAKKSLQFIEQVGKTCFPAFGSAYVLLARAKVIPLTPIRLKWNQKLGDIRISPNIGHIARKT